jgi:hypothetical protein
MLPTILLSLSIIESRDDKVTSLLPTRLTRHQRLCFSQKEKIKGELRWFATLKLSKKGSPNHPQRLVIHIRSSNFLFIGIRN